MPNITTDPLKAAKALAAVLAENDAHEAEARWSLAWTAVFVADRAAMATAIEDAHGKKIANAFRNTATVTKAMAAGYGGELPPDDVRRHVEQWAPKTWQQLTAKVIRPIAEAGDLTAVDPTVLRKQLDDEKAAESVGDSPEGETPEIPKDLVMATLTVDDLANGVIAIASREPQWDGMDGKQRTTLITNLLGDVAATATAKG